MEKTLAMILAGGRGTRLNILAKHRAKPAVPFGGIYRLIDFTLSNIMNSNIGNIGILTQYRPSSLIEHIQAGETWGFYGKNRSTTILPPYTGETDSSWYKGTADAIHQNRQYLERFAEIDKVLILSGDHIYSMNYDKLIEYHKKKKANLTIVARAVSMKEAKRFGTIKVDKTDKVVSFDEKPQNPESNLVSMGIYLFNKQELISILEEDAHIEHSERDFGKDIIKSMIHRSKVCIYRFDDYWKDVGTVHSYWDTSMELLKKNKKINLTRWNVRTNLSHRLIADRKPCYIAKNANIANSLVSDGCIINGKVENSIISPGVIIEKDVYIKDSIIFHDTQIRTKSVIDKCIIDKGVTISSSVKLGTGKLPGAVNKQFSAHELNGICIVGKSTQIPKGVSCGRNCVFYPSLSMRSFKKKHFGDGETLAG